jgi:hypothetical protein
MHQGLCLRRQVPEQENSIETKCCNRIEIYGRQRVWTPCQRRSEARFVLNLARFCKSFDRFLGSGTFVIEYVGEVVTKEEFLSRRSAYAANKEAHFYFLELSASHYIDAKNKGNLSR